MSGPYTIAESQLCETPVVSFNTGYANDIVDNVTGVLVTDITAEALADGIEQMISKDASTLKQMGKEARTKVMEMTSEENQFKGIQATNNSNTT